MPFNYHEIIQIYISSKNIEFVIFLDLQVEELSFAADEMLEVLDKPADDPDWWRCRNAVGNVGLVPRNYIRVIKTPLPSALTHPPVQYSSTVAGNAPQQVIGGGEEVRLTFAMASPNAAEFARKPWYWGVISRSECETILNNLAISGEFIIRDSESHVSIHRYILHSVPRSLMFFSNYWTDLRDGT